MTADSIEWWRTVLIAGRGELATRRQVDAETYLVLPRRRHPRILVDTTSPAALADVVRRSVAQRRLPAPIASAILASRVIQRSPSQWSVSPNPGAESLRDHLTRILGGQISMSITIGPARMNRKPVVRCYAGDRLTAIAKLGPDDHTADMVDNEAHWLAELEADPIDGLRTPSLLHHGRYGTSALVVMSILPLESDAGVAFDRMPDELLGRFTARYRTAGPLATSPWFGELPERCVGVEDDVVRSAGAFFAESDDVELEFEAWHGDWSPWNLGQTPSGDWCLWDWERTAIGVPRGFDQVHRHLHYGAGLDAAREALRAIGVSDDRLEFTIGLYLLELAARLHEGKAWTDDDDNPVRRALADSLTRIGAPVGWER